MLVARTLAESGADAEALEEYAQVLQRAPNHVDARLAAGALALRLGQPDAVAGFWAPVRGRLSVGDRRELARILLRQGQREEARVLYEEVLSAEPGLRDFEMDRAFRGEIRPTMSAASNAGAPAVAAPAAPPAETANRPKIKFADVGGMDALKERLRMDIVYPLQKPELFSAYGKRAGGGVLLYGPPGCGKTHLARAAAGECNASFIVVEIPQVLDMWLGESEKRLHALFERARKESPTILFFDEIEAIGAARHQLRHGPGRRMVNQLLLEMDGVAAENANVLVLGATNAPWDIDPALRRPGRFDRVLFVPPPDLAAREAVLTLTLQERPTDRLDLGVIARRTARYSGADLVHLCAVASERALTEAVRTGRLRPITQSDLVASLDQVKPTTLEWIETARRYVTYANQAGLYDDVKRFLERGPD